MRERVIVHIGTEKTGTTSIQEFLHINRESLDRHGISYLRTPGLRNHRKLPLLFIRDDRPDEHAAEMGVQSKAARKRWKEEFKTEVEAEIFNSDESIQSFVISSEHFQSRLLFVDEIEALRAFLRKHFVDVKILVYLRRQDQLAVSHYSTLCKCGVVEDTIREDLMLPANVTHQSHYYNYFNLLEKWSAVFGFNSIIVRIFERNRLKDEDLINDFIDASSVLREEWQLKRPAKQNESLSTLSQEILLKYNHHFPTYTDGKLNSEFRELGNRLIRRLGKKIPGPPKLPTRSKAVRFRNIFSESNQRLAVKYLGKNHAFSNDFSKYPEKDHDKPSVLSISDLDEIFFVFSNFMRVKLNCLGGEYISHHRGTEESEKPTSMLVEDIQNHLTDTANAYIRYARRLFDEGQISESISIYADAVKLRPETSSVFVALVEELVKREDVDNALMCLKTALRFDPESFPLNFMLGELMTKQDLLSEAEHAFNRCVEIDNTSPWPHHCLGNIYFWMGRLNDAADEYGKAINIKPDLAAAYKQLGDVFSKLKDPDQASVAYDKALELDHKVFEAM